jgi:DNA glycosylase AlkZ-like
VDLTLRDLNRATLARQLLLRREPLAVLDGVRRVVAIQAQEPPSPYIALWNRLDPFDPADVDAAFARGALVKAGLMRITLHAVDAQEYPVFHAAMRSTLRDSRLYDRRFRSTGLSITEVDALVPHVVAFASTPRTNAEVEAMLAECLDDGVPVRGVWWALRTFAPLIHAPTGGPWSFGPRPSYIAAPMAPAAAAEAEPLPTLIRRYLEGFGPASTDDFAQFALHRRRTVRDALQTMAGTLTTLAGPGGRELFDVLGAPLPAGDTPAPPRLMAMWDSILLAYADRSRIIPDEYRPLVIRRNGDVLPTVLVDGFVAGVWRPVEEGIEARAFHPLPDDAWDGLAQEARSLLALLAGRGPAPYGGRFARWWPTLPPTETRILPA